MHDTEGDEMIDYKELAEQYRKLIVRFVDAYAASYSIILQENSRKIFPKVKLKPVVELNYSEEYVLRSALQLDE